VWDTTVIDTFSLFYVLNSTIHTCLTATDTKIAKRRKYNNFLTSNHQSLQRRHQINQQIFKNHKSILCKNTSSGLKSYSKKKYLVIDLTTSPQQILI